MGRLEYVDIFRGIAILIMIFIEIFDFLSKKNIYIDVPWYVPQINSVTWVPPVWLFTMVAGMSIALLLEKQNNATKGKALLIAAKRYFPYIAISLPFTIVMWNFATFVRWEEALQGIGLCAIFAAAIFAFKPRTRYLIAISIGLMFLNVALNSIPLGISKVPSGLELLPAIAVNALFRGWFSVTNLMPFMLAGAVCLKFLREKKLRKIFLFGAVFLAIALALHFSGFKIDFYGRSLGHFFFGIGQSALIMGFVFWVWQRIKSTAWNVIGNFGKAAIIAYLGHYLLIGLPAKQLGTLPDVWALVLTPVLIAGIYLLCLGYLQLTKKGKAH